MNTRRELTNGIVSLLPGLAITFVADHTLSMGLLFFAIWTIAAGVAGLVLRLLAPSRNWDLLALAALAVGILALACRALDQSQLFPYVVGSWTVLLGLLALRRTDSGQRFLGVLSVAFGMSQLLMPVNPVVNVGMFGAFLAVVGVFLVISALSPSATVESEGASKTHD